MQVVFEEPDYAKPKMNKKKTFIQSILLKMGLKANRKQANIVALLVSFLFIFLSAWILLETFQPVGGANTPQNNQPVQAETQV